MKMYECLYVFGYGALIWKPDIEYSDRKIGYIKGYQRRFWQGSVEHRGTAERWGRVATLIPSNNPEDKVWGIMYKVENKNNVAVQRGKLDNREKTLGEYETTEVEFFPRDTNDETLTATTYIALDTNRLFWKEENIDKQVNDIINAQGFAGPNIHYVTNLADFLRNNVPEEDDQHLYELDRKLRDLYESGDEL
ncbi:Glutathione-specific gamma-glutamylcyclotransferase 1 [Mactra antiquata]